MAYSLPVAVQFGVFRACTFWSYIDCYEQLSAYVKHPTHLHVHDETAPMELVVRFSAIVRGVRASPLPRTDAGKGRAFIRLALQDHLMSSFVQLLSADRSFLALWYAECALFRNDDALLSTATLLSALSVFDFSAMQPYSPLLDLPNPFSKPAEAEKLAAMTVACGPTEISRAEWHHLARDA